MPGAGATHRSREPNPGEHAAVSPLRFVGPDQRRVAANSASIIRSSRSCSLLEACGFHIEAVERMTTVNTLPTTRTPRYVVIARRTTR